MKEFTFSLPASLEFKVQADTEGDARKIAQRILEGNASYDRSIPIRFEVGWLHAKIVIPSAAHAKLLKETKLEDLQTF